MSIFYDITLDQDVIIFRSGPGRLLDVGCATQTVHGGPRVPIDKSETTEPRPGCRHPNSCHRHGQCMYVGCEHNTSGLKLPAVDPKTTSELCKHDGKPCYASAGTTDAHWRCGTSQCSPAQSKTTEFTAGVEAARRRICMWLRTQANAEYKLRPDGAARSAFVEAHNVILKMDLPESAESHD